jgi:hypothetical protein
MNPRKYFRQLWKALSHPNVFIFIVIGTGVIFLTFLTDNNAVEIAISGFASVFVGIGVNNLSSFETSAKDAKKTKGTPGSFKADVGTYEIKNKWLTK